MRRLVVTRRSAPPTRTRTMASPLSSADGTPETASTLKTSAGGDAPGELATPRSPSQPASCDQRAVVATDEIDAPHLASLVEQYHGPWRKRGAGRRAALGGDVLGFKQARRAAPDPLQDPSLARARVLRPSPASRLRTRPHLVSFSSSSFSLPPSAFVARADATDLADAASVRARERRRDERRVAERLPG